MIVDFNGVIESLEAKNNACPIMINKENGDDNDRILAYLIPYGIDCLADPESNCTAYGAHRYCRIDNMMPRIVEIAIELDMITLDFDGLPSLREVT